MRPVKMRKRSRMKKFPVPRAKVLLSKTFLPLMRRLLMPRRKMPETKAGS